MDFSHVQYVIFDTFGTVVDWHGTVIEEGRALGKKYGLNIDWNQFVITWRTEGYIKITRAIAAGKRVWESVDSMYMKKLRDLMEVYKFPAMAEEEIKNFNRVWHRLRPWPDAVEGLTLLKRKFKIGPFSNGDFSLLLNMAKNMEIPWDFITSADIFKKYKADPSIYFDELKLLGAEPDEVVMVAAHPNDLDRAKLAKCITAFVPRPLEYGINSGYVEPEGKQPIDIEVPDFIQLAHLLCGK